MASLADIERVCNLANAANQRRMPVAEAIREAVGPAYEAGLFFAVGTPESKFIHDTHYGSKFFSHTVPGWHHIEKQDKDSRPILLTTKIAKIAIASALFGDLNHSITTCDDPYHTLCLCTPEAQSETGLTDRPRPHFGWRPDPLEDEGVRLYALPELINGVSKLSGVVDIVTPMLPGNHIEPLAELGVGMFACRFGCDTVASIRIQGYDLPETDAFIPPSPLV